MKKFSSITNRTISIYSTLLFSASLSLMSLSVFTTAFTPYKYSNSFQHYHTLDHLRSNRNNHHHSIVKFISQDPNNKHLLCLLFSSNRDESERKSTPKGYHNSTSVGKKTYKKRRQQQSRKSSNSKGEISKAELLKRLTQLEGLVSSQAVELRKLRQECQDLGEAVATFGQVVELLRNAGLTMSETPKLDSDSLSGDEMSKKQKKSKGKDKEIEGNKDNKSSGYLMPYEESEIFGSAPSSVIDAADSAGSAILAAMLAGKGRMLVDVRDAELSKDPDILVQFIELAVLPVAAGLEGLNSDRNRVKIVFPTVSQLLTYRKTMALAAPEVITLSTLGFGSVEENDNLVVVIAPSPDDEEGHAMLEEILQDKRNTQPIVLINYHMAPLSVNVTDFETVYHLRLLSVQYMTGDMSQDYTQDSASLKKDGIKSVIEGAEDAVLKEEGNSGSNATDIVKSEDDEALEAAMEHAHQAGINQGITRAMVIRAYPRPWHVFVDTSPDTEADFEVAATFDEEPSQDDVNYAIIECLEGSEREDELVAQQMQEALEAGQLNRISEMLGILPTDEAEEEDNEFDLDN